MRNTRSVIAAVLALVVAGAIWVGAAAWRARSEQSEADAALLEAVRQGDAAAAAQALRRGADPNCSGAEGEPPLCVAALAPEASVIHWEPIRGRGPGGSVVRRRGYLAIVKLLVDAGADPAVGCRDGHTPVEQASRMEETAAVKALEGAHPRRR